MFKPLWTLLGLSFIFALSINSAHAGAELDAVNTEVNLRALQMDDNFQVLLSAQEMDDLKINLVAIKIAPTTDGTTADVQAKAEAAFVTYDITDPTQQRKLLREILIQSIGNGGGHLPGEKK